ncbi:hypothetical protein [Saccharothrix hoggarensis]|uniref:Uncharacterized protein n=1 Tax=Saccharothrix hoggarensis TaxID=913853 RepID=A0ABW3QXN5_9PSEU
MITLSAPEAVMHFSDRSVFSHTVLEVAPATEVTVEVVDDDEVEVFVGERSEVFGVANGVTLVLGEASLDHLVTSLTKGRDQLRERAGTA